MGMLTLIGMLGLEGFLFVWSVTTKKVHRKEIAIIRIGTLFLFVLLLGFGFYEWSFRYGPFLLLLVIQFLAATRALLGMKESFYGIGGGVLESWQGIPYYISSLFVLPSSYPNMNKWQLAGTLE